MSEIYTDKDFVFEIVPTTRHENQATITFKRSKGEPKNA